MFEFQSLASPPKALALETRRGRPINNEQALPDQAAQRRDALLREIHGQRWVQRIAATGIYNCAGHVWAARRTAIYEGAEWDKILDDDDYSVVKEPTVGDLVVYRDSEGTYLHVGMVMELCEGLTRDSPPIPRILSKWSDVSGEYLHYVHDVWFRVQFPNFAITYIRL